MGEKTGIEWSHHTWSPWIGCQEVSEACFFCYAKGLDKRFKRDGAWGPHGTRQPQSDAYWSRLFAMDRAAARAGEQRRVFPSMCDPFDNHSTILQCWRDRHWDAIRRTPHLTHLLLTKRPQNIARYLPDDWGDGYPNVWLGCTVENQTEADRRIPHLLAVPSRIRFLSCEPLLGPLNLSGFLAPPSSLPGRHVNLSGGRWIVDADGAHLMWGGVGWVITGHESGPKRRATKPEWTLALRDQCASAEVPFFYKQAFEGGRMNYAPLLGGREYKEFPA